MRGSGRAVAIIIALILAGVAVYAITAYVRGIEQRAFEDAELVDVLIAQGEIPEGVTADAAQQAGLIETGTIPNRNVPAGAVTALEQLDGLLTLDRVLPNEVLVLGRWGSPDDVGARALAVPEDFQAISLQVGIPPGVAGFIRPGDEISLIVTTESVEDTDEEPDDVDDAEDADVVVGESEVRTQYLLQNITVLTVGQRVTTEDGREDVQEGGGSVLLTLALEAEDAERLVFAIETASLYLTLLPPDASPVETPGRTLDTLFDE